VADDTSSRDSRGARRGVTRCRQNVSFTTASRYVRELRDVVLRNEEAVVADDLGGLGHDLRDRRKMAAWSTYGLVVHKTGVVRVGVLTMARA
jgi:hypothetical protein